MLSRVGSQGRRTNAERAFVRAARSHTVRLRNTWRIVFIHVSRPTAQLLPIWAGLLYNHHLRRT